MLRPNGFVLFVASAALCSSAAGQIAYTEPPDLTGQALGTVAAGDNTVTGSLSANYTGGPITGDVTDSFSFTVPAAMRITSLTMLISNLNGSGAILNPGVQIVGGPFLFAPSPSGSNTLPIPAPGYLAPGAYTFSVFTGVSAADPPFTSRSFNYILRIHADLDTGACCNRWTGSCAVLTPATCASVGLRYDGVNSACSPAACKACPADFDGVNGLQIADIFAMLNSWFAGCP